jgi:endonuclease YncB( thermonuclease family)
MMHRRIPALVVTIALLIPLSWTAARELTVQYHPATVTKVVDGDTIRVLFPGGSPFHGDEEKIRLLYIDTPEIHDNPHDRAMVEGRRARLLLKKRLKPGDRVYLVNPEGKLKRGYYGRLLAIVYLQNRETTIQELMIRSGYSVVWEKYGSPPEPWKGLWQKAEDEAREKERGCWGTAREWMMKKDKE